MALNKQFIHFQTKSAFNEQKENISDTSIAFIKETGEIYTHDKLYGSISIASSTANGLMPKEHYSIIDKESNNQFVTELSNNVSTTADKVYIQYKSRYFGNNLKYAKMCNILSATSTNAGVMSAADKVKLDSLSNYTLPTADSSTLGGIKIGSGLNIDSNGTVSVDNKLYILVNSLESVTTPDANKIYLVLNSSSTSETNSFTEYVWITSDTGGKWEKLGEFKTDVDLTPYAKTADVTSAIDAVRESVATHEQTLDKHHQVLNILSETKVEWFVIPITGAVYEDILSGVKDYITIPYDISRLIEGASQLKSGQAGIKLEVADEASVNAVYLPFTLVSQAYILPSFDDLVIRGTSLSSGQAYDTRYHVNVDAKTNYIKLEKAAELPWLDVTPQSEEELGKFVAAFIHEAGLNGKADYELNLNASTDLTQYRGIRIDLGEGNIVETPVVATVGKGFICAPVFLSDNEFVFGTTKETSGKFILHIYNLSSQYANSLNDYAYNKAEIDTKLTGVVKVQKLTQEEYDALKTKDENVLYAIIEPAN